MVDWSQVPSFSEAEFTCKCGCGVEKMDETFIDKLQELRDKCGFPFRITSGYRCSEHPVEANRAARGKVGAHTTGQAADIAISGGDAYTLIKHATNMGFTGLGVSQKDGTRFIHLDDIYNVDGFPRPWVWSY
jgi:zinc D-Ala-D-Ala carboxypeptidase